MISKEKQQQWLIAEDLTRQALVIAESINAPEMIYLWEWQLGRIFKQEQEHEAALKASIAMHPLGRIGEPEEIARSIAWFLDPSQSWVTGKDKTVCVVHWDGCVLVVISAIWSLWRCEGSWWVWMYFFRSDEMNVIILVTFSVKKMLHQGLKSSCLTAEICNWRRLTKNAGQFRPS